MHYDLSILIPTRNTACTELVGELVRQCSQVPEQTLRYEIVVCDDASTNGKIRLENQAIREMAHVRLIELKENIGRAAVRNLLAREAAYEWLLFIDADLKPATPLFIQNYLQAIRAHEAPAICGDYVLTPPPYPRSSLRYIYEQSVVRTRTLTWRQRHPYRAFRVCNLLIQKPLLLSHPFNESITRYGYEDLLLGATLQQSGVAIMHIDNPVRFSHFEENHIFLQKTEESLHTLAALEPQLSRLSLLSAKSRWLRKTGISLIFCWWFRLRQNQWKQNLCGPHPSLLRFKLYKLGLWLTVVQSS